MITPEHRRPLMAFAFVALAALLILGNGLRARVVSQLVEGEAPAPLVTALAPDLVLGHRVLAAEQPRPHVRVTDKPTPEAAAPAEARPGMPAGPESATSVDRAVPAGTKGAARHRSQKAGSGHASRSHPRTKGKARPQRAGHAKGPRRHHSSPPRHAPSPPVHRSGAGHDHGKSHPGGHARSQVTGPGHQGPGRTRGHVGSHRHGPARGHPRGPRPGHGGHGHGHGHGHGQGHGHGRGHH